MKDWVGEGLRFRCTECGHCCTGSPGYVYLAASDVQRLAKGLHLSEAEFTRKYTRWMEGELVLLDAPGSDCCIFLEGNRCRAYDARPTQCRTFPWWAQNLRSREAWEEAARSCEGINHPDAPLVSVSEINQQHELYCRNVWERYMVGHEVKGPL